MQIDPALSKKFFSYVMPSILAFALSGVYTIVDGFFIGQSLGDTGLTAITLGYPISALVGAVGTGLGRRVMPEYVLRLIAYKVLNEKRKGAFDHEII